MSSAPERGEAARREEERVAREDRRHHEARLQEDDREQERVGPGAVGLDHLREVLVEVQEEVDEPVDEIHSLLSRSQAEPLILSGRPGEARGPWAVRSIDDPSERGQSSSP